MLGGGYVTRCESWGPRELVSMAEAEGATYVRGQLVDRLAPGGQLRRILPNKPLWEQFPVACRVPESIAGPHDRIVAFKVPHTF